MTPMDNENLVRHLSEMIRIPTVSSFDGDEDKETFAAFRDYLKRTYPHTWEKGEPRLIGKCGLLYKISGRSKEGPSVLMAHYDVVPADPAAWDFEPFAGDIAEGSLRGRGSLDTKGTLCAILEAVEAHLASGGTFAHDLYLSFSGEEEVEGSSSKEMAHTLEKEGVRPALVLDEGGAVIPEGLPFVPGLAAMVGIAEKGVANVRLTLKGKGGHASVPPKHTTLGRLAKAAAAIEAHPFKTRLTGPVVDMFHFIGKKKGGPVGFACRHVSLFSLPVRWLASRMGGTFAAMVRTSCAVTMMEGSPSYNILPETSTLGVNLRVLPGETLEGALDHLKSVIADPEISIEVVSGGGPSGISKAEGESWEKLCRAVSSVWPKAMTVPYTLNGGTDSRAWHGICDHVYKFTPMVMSASDRAMVHGLNEAIRLESLGETALFYRYLVREL